MSLQTCGHSTKHFPLRWMYGGLIMALKWVLEDLTIYIFLNSDLYLCLLRIFSSLASSAVSRAGDDVRGQTVARY